MNDGVLLFQNYVVYAWLLLIPAVALEARELRTRLALPAGRAVAVSAAANLASTLLTTLAAFGAGWLSGLFDFIATPGAGEADLAALAALVPCFFVSVWCEEPIAAAMLGRVPRDALRDAVFQANLLSFSMLAIVPVVRFAKSLVVNGHVTW